MQSICIGYLIGALDTSRWIAAVSETRITVCDVPSGVTIPQLVALMRRYLDQHPENLHLTGASLIPHIINEAFPCGAPAQ